MSDKNKIELVLNDFRQNDKDKLISGVFNHFYKFHINTGNYFTLRLIRYVFDKFLGFTIWDQPFEKINWEIAFEYKGVLASVAHQKFGFNIYVDRKTDETEAKTLGEEILTKIDKAIKLARPYVESEGIRALENGEIIISNKLRDIEEEFKFFVRESLSKRKKSNVPDVVSITKKLPARISFKQYLEGNYLEDAAYIAFYSLLEHLCILCLAFTSSNDKYNIAAYSKKTWQEKYKQVFPLEIPEFRDYYDKFIDYAKYKRNPAAHGLLDKNNTLFDFYLPKAKHRIPMRLYSRKIAFKTQGEADLEQFMS